MLLGNFLNRLMGRLYSRCQRNSQPQGTNPHLMNFAEARDKIQEIIKHQPESRISLAIIQLRMEPLQDRQSIWSHPSLHSTALFVDLPEDETMRQLRSILIDLEKQGGCGSSLYAYAGMATYPDPARTLEQLFCMAQRELEDIHTYQRPRVGVFEDFFTRRGNLEASDEEFLLTVRSLLRVIDLIDQYTYTHSLRVAAYCGLMAHMLHLSRNTRQNLQAAALLHDIGKLGVGKEILCQAGPLDDHQWKIMRQHPVWSANMIRKSGHFLHLEPAVRHHHERYDGQGYPDGLAGEDIPLEARLITLADSFDAMISHRPYRRARSREEALRVLQNEAGKQFDPALVPLFAETVHQHKGCCWTA